MPSCKSTDEDEVSSDTDIIINEHNWPSLFRLHHGQLVIATAPSDCHQVRGLLMFMRGRQLVSGFVAQSFEIFETSTKRMVICDADDYNIEPQLPSAFDATVDASAGAVTRTSTQLPSHAASVDDNDKGHAASHADATSQSAAAASSPTANSCATAGVDASAGAAVTSPRPSHQHLSTVVIYQSDSDADNDVPRRRSSHSASNAAATSQSAVAPTRTLPQHDFDEEEDDDQSYHTDAEAVAVGEFCSFTEAVGREPRNARVVGRIVGATSRHVQKYVLQKSDGAQCVVPSVLVMKLPSISETEDDSRVDSQYHDDGFMDGTANESAVLAADLSGSIEYFDVAKMDAHQIWYCILLKRHLSGGMLTRTILIAAQTDSACQPLWNATTTQEKLRPIWRNKEWISLLTLLLNTSLPGCVLKCFPLLSKVVTLIPSYV